jgi:hypothetical protein
MSEPRLPLDPFEPEPPRRNALRALLASGLALVGLSRVIESGSAKVQTQKKKKNGKGAKVVLGSSQPYDVAAGAATQVTSTCPSKSVPISVSTQIIDQRCWISNSTRSDTGTGWDVRVTCPPTVTTTGTVQAICLK